MSFEASLKVGDGAYTYYPVSEIEGAAQLPYSLEAGSFRLEWSRNAF